MRNRIVLFLLGWLSFTATGWSQEDRADITMVAQARDSVVAAVPDSTVKAVLMAADSIGVPKMKMKMKAAFKPNPTKATLLALVPGLGQIYNRKYWKLPLVYGGLMGCMYAITWNDKNYGDYSVAYQDIMYDAVTYPNEPDKWSNSWKILTSMDPATAIKDANFKDKLKRQKDYFRRYRDLSIIITAGVYLLSIVDAYVDAQLFDFDISPDLSLRVEPAVTTGANFSSRAYGLNCSLKF